MADWAEGLDFESYFDNWLSLATSVSNMHTKFMDLDTDAVQI
jgi:hypothetical protein